MSIRLFSYKLVNDSGFAPNPFHGFITLANCKPRIRRAKKIGDWIAGFTSTGLNGDKVGNERLIYLMKVTDKIDYYEYWTNSKYQYKIPQLNSRKIENKAGDNIYKPIKDNEFIQIKNNNHSEKDKERDLNGKYVLISDLFYYFGKSAIYLPSELRPSVPKGQSSQGNRTKDQEKAYLFIDYIQSNYPIGIIDYPHLWPRKCKK